ncbi:MAG: hypothetical protein AVDCRST_MAG89-259, partial [uncultured Gemmatimonadetes bacterium]
ERGKGAALRRKQHQRNGAPLRAHRAHHGLRPGADHRPAREVRLPRRGGRAGGGGRPHRRRGRAA